MQLAELAKRYKNRNLRSASPNSLRLWDIALRLFDRYLGRPATIDDLNDDTVCGFCRWRRGKGVSSATINRDLVSLLALWRWAHKTGVISRWPDVPLEKVPHRIPTAWTKHEFCTLIATTRSLKGRIGSVPESIWWESLLLVLFDSGERIGAVLDLTWREVDLRNAWILFRAETRKGQHEDSIVRIAPDTAAMLRKLYTRTEKAVFPWPLTRNYIWKRYDKILGLAGLPRDRNRKFHCVRKTTASHLEAAGGNATAALRHATRKTTQVYLDPRITTPPQPVDLLWRPG